MRQLIVYHLATFGHFTTRDVSYRSKHGFARCVSAKEVQLYFFLPCTHCPQYSVRHVGLAGLRRIFTKRDLLAITT